MQIHQIHPKTANKKKKRVGRGGKRGTTSGRGQKGQKSRSGRNIRPAEMDIILKLPKLRGQKKPALKKTAVRIINLAELDKKMKGGVIDKKTLMEAGLIDNVRQKIKILGKGRVGKTFRIEGIKVSKSVKEKIEKAGGSVK